MKTDFWFCVLLSVVMLICSVTICSAMHVWLFHKSCCDDFWKMYQAFSMFDVTDVQLCWNLDDPMLRCLWFQVLCAWKRAYLRCFAAPIIRQHPISKKGQYHWLLEPSVLCVPQLIESVLVVSSIWHFEQLLLFNCSIGWVTLCWEVMFP